MVRQGRRPRTRGRLIPVAQLIDSEPGHVEAPHGHDASEIYFMLSADLAIGEASVKPGMLVYIKAETVYGPSTTESACRFLRLGVTK